MTPTLDAASILSIQSECFAEDVPLPESGCAGWTESELRAYFESGGEDVPPPRHASPPVEPSGEVHSYSIGGVTVEVGSPCAPELVPWLPPGLRSSLGSSQEALATMRWMMVQLKLGQDMLLLGEPGGGLRSLALWVCATLRREVEYVGVTRDTCEADLKQRRELRGGSMLYADAPPLRAACHGRVLLLEGIEKAERNVLPLLNNLLENREMALDDGGFLAAPAMSGEEEEGGARGRGLRFAKRGFVVIGIGLPQPTYAGTPLDPPLRSRFATRRVRFVAGSELLSRVVAAAPRLSPARARQVCAAADALRLRSAAASGAPYEAAGGRRLAYFPEGGAERAAALLEAFDGADAAAAVERRLPLAALHLPPDTLKGVRREDLKRPLPPASPFASPSPKPNAKK